MKDYLQEWDLSLKDWKKCVWQKHDEPHQEGLKLNPVGKEDKSLNYKDKKLKQELSAIDETKGTEGAYQTSQWNSRRHWRRTFIQCFSLSNVQNM